MAKAYNVKITICAPTQKFRGVDITDIKEVLPKPTREKYQVGYINLQNEWIGKKVVVVQLK